MKKLCKFLLNMIRLGIVSSLLWFLGSCTRSSDRSSMYPPTPAFPQKADQTFLSTIAAGGVNLNDGITLERSLPMSPDNITVNSIGFAVFNHTNEPVVFVNQGFGVVVYRYDEATQQWKAVHLQHFPADTPKILPPRIEKWDLNIGNDWTLLADDLQSQPYRQLRLYVSGMGQTTAKKYGAYLDVTINPRP